MVKADWTIYEEDYWAINSVLKELLKNSNSQSVLLIDKTGQMIASVGLEPDFDLMSFASLCAADFEANSQRVMADSRLLLVASGTATLQGALFATPLIIVYRVSLFNYLIARRLIKIDNIGLVNIILGEDVCPEFVQVQAKSKSIAETAIGLLEDPRERDSMVSKFGSLREMLAGPGGCRRVAEISEQLINSS